MSADAYEGIESSDELVAFLRSGEKPAERFRVGTEHEKIGLYEDTHARVPYEGERGIGRLLDDIATIDGWKRVCEGDNVIALEKDGASITLEPGGQLELSGAPLRTIHETCDEFHSHLALMKRVCGPLGIVFVGLGIDPIHPVDRVPIMPKSRYRIMREYLPTRGSRSLEMMFVTATVQANFDYASEADMVSKVRTAVAVSPIVSAIFANSSLYLGKDSGFASRRLAAWFDTDPDRCGMPPWVFDPDFGYERYVEWALDVPMFFVVRDGTYHFAKGATFRHFLERGFEGHRAVLDDWDRHLTTLFPDVRLKRYIEVRCADAVPPGLTCSLPALWKGIFYDDQALASAWALVEGLDIEQREAARVEVAKRGLASQMGSQPILELAHELAAIAREGLARIGDAGRNDADECAYLDPIFEQLESGLSPGETVAVRWEAEWGRSIDRLIDFARY